MAQHVPTIPHEEGGGQFQADAAGRITARPAAAAPLISTGVDASGCPLASGAVDPIWTLTPDPQSNCFNHCTFVIGNPGGLGWTGNRAQSQWLSATPCGQNVNGTFGYTTTFTLTACQALGEEVTGCIAYDDSFGSVSLNGKATGIHFVGCNCAHTDPWTFFQDFEIDSGFQPGVNTLTFFVTNTGGPAGAQINVDARNAPELDASTAAVPAGLALGTLAILADRRRKVKAS